MSGGRGKPTRRAKAQERPVGRKMTRPSDLVLLNPEGFLAGESPSGAGEVRGCGEAASRSPEGSPSWELDCPEDLASSAWEKLGRTILSGGGGDALTGRRNGNSSISPSTGGLKTEGGDRCSGGGGGAGGGGPGGGRRQMLGMDRCDRGYDGKGIGPA